jgi:outer membrane protein OmpA-like peptidoglycan-associated protein
LKRRMLLAAGLALTLSAFAQTNSQSMGVEPMSETPTFRVNVVSRTVQAVNYQHRSGATKIDFAGTDLMPAANGEAKVESKKGYIEIEVEFGNLDKPTTFGNEYLTYVMWAISPEGRAVNLGEIIVGGNHRAKVDVTTDLQAFALIVTAEPYFAVHEPSNVVVIENVVRADTKGSVEALSVKHDFLERGGYIPTGYKFDPVILNAKLPLEFFEARNAVRIAQSEGAERYASDSYQHAIKLMQDVDAYAVDKNVPRNTMIATARETVQTAEDARAISVKRMEEARLQRERRASANAQAKSQGEADDAMRQKELAQADTARAQSDAARAQAEADKAKSDQSVSEAASASAVASAQADAERSRLAALEAQKNAQQSDDDKAAMRTKLATQLNLILQTRDTARGLIVSMSDVLFDSGKYSLKPGAREKLAKVAGILVSYPGLNIAVGGYTDNVGTDAMNQKLSENRAGSVRDYLVKEGVAIDSVTSSGFGEAQPVATNDNAAGRQQNRRVELLVSGEAIGHPTNVTTGSLQ